MDETTKVAQQNSGSHYFLLRIDADGVFASGPQGFAVTLDARYSDSLRTAVIETIGRSMVVGPPTVGRLFGPHGVELQDAGPKQQLYGNRNLASLSAEAFDRIRNGA